MKQSLMNYNDSKHRTDEFLMSLFMKMKSFKLYESSIVYFEFLVYDYNGPTVTIDLNWNDSAGNTKCSHHCFNDTFRNQF